MRPTIVRVEHDVIELEVAVHDRRRRRVGGQMLAQPVGERVHLRQRRRARSVPALGPPAHLALDEAGRLAEGAETLRVNVDRVQIRQRIDHRLADAPPRRGVRERRRLFGAHHQAAPALHRVEHRPDDLEVFAEQVRPRREGKDAVHRGEPAELARHVVRGRRHRAERRPADDEVHVAEADEIGQVRVAAGKLRDVRLARHVQARHAARRQMLAKPRDEPRPIELFAGTNARGRRRVSGVPSAKRLSCAPCASTIPTRSSIFSGG